MTTPHEPRLARVATVVADPARSRMLHLGRLMSTADGYALTDAGARWLRGLGMNPGLPSRRRRFAYRCLDWSERRDHLAGQLADEIYQHFTTVGWLRRAAGRAVEVTPAGQRELLPRLSADSA